MADPRRTEVHRYLRGLFNVGTVAGLSDGELLDRFAARRGESAELAFAALVERHGPMVLRVCRKVLHDSDDAADAFQATFLVLARKAGSIRRRDSLGAYLHGVALRVASCACSAVARRRKHERMYAERVAVSYLEKAPDDLGRVIHEELGRLPERFRGVAVLCDLEGKTYVEAAGLLGCPPGTVMSRLAEARRRLRGRLARRGLAPSAGAIGVMLAAETRATAKGLPVALAEATIQAAARFAAGPATPGAVVSASVMTLTEGVLKTMFLTQLKSLALLGLVGGAVATGAGVLAQTPATPAQALPLPASASPAADPRDDPDSAAQPTAAPEDPAVSVAPADKRLHSLEKKLDRLLNVLESNAAKPSPATTQRAQASGSTPARKPSAVTGVMPGMPNDMVGMMGAAAMEPGMPNRRMGMNNVEERLRRAEQQLKEVADRLNRLEQAVFENRYGDRGPRGSDVRTTDGNEARARATPPADSLAAPRALPVEPRPESPTEPTSPLPLGPGRSRVN
ncbi:RNA polymerase sigma-70 factor, ECF subfamily [Singulisphaera sp. GP187]|uniref:sigma-70 family RNA polymerase sigma factor n=1 Tax=Singulisphaera sp. GP187 TaxID=1882752 RepID=UPI00092B3CDD|nr:sigma-70 family RNA polymerase sigma factor [Singulisphaera sp. GP187]SIO39357.1 RNA polymerase sigma-70 factor, ECF subfamily [Singulisphaera sp. GP187]